MTASGELLDEPRGAALTPAHVARVHQRIWTARGELAGRTFVVPACPYTVAEQAAPEQAGRRAGYLPPRSRPARPGTCWARSSP